MAQVIGHDAEWNDKRLPYAKRVVSCFWDGKNGWDLSPSDTDEFLASLTADDILYGQNLKSDLSHSRVPNPKCRVYDTMVLAWLVNENGDHSLEGLAKQYLGRELEKPIKTKDGEFCIYWRNYKTLIDDPAVFEEVRRYCMEDTRAGFDLGQLLLPAVEAEGLLDWYHQTEGPMVTVTAQLERLGVLVDETKRQRAVVELSAQREATDAFVQKSLGYPVPYASPQKLGKVLFTTQWVEEKVTRQVVGQYKNGNDRWGWVDAVRPGLGLKPFKTTKTGLPQTDKETLLNYEDHPVVAGIQDVRELDKLLGTYLLKFPDYCFDGRLFYTLNPWGTVTGRDSSSGPNMQNVPAHGDNGPLLRSMFIARPGFLLVVADYGQIEYRLLAEFTQEPALVKAFLEGVDVHAQAAALVLGKRVEDVVKAERQFGKNGLNFPCIYGAGPRKISATCTKFGYPLSPEQAKEYIDKYYSVLPNVLAWKEGVWENARRWGYVVLPSGRKRRLPDIRSWKQGLRSYAERQAINVFPQGTAADILKIATVNLARDQGLVPLLRVHDELVFEVPESDATFVADIVKDEMEAAAWQLGIQLPIVADVSIGESWADKK